jgi:hypothetical protein
MTDNTQGELSKEKWQKNLPQETKNWSIYKYKGIKYIFSIALLTWCAICIYFLCTYMYCVNSELCTSVNWLWDSLLTNHHDLKRNDMFACYLQPHNFDNQSS